MIYPLRDWRPYGSVILPLLTKAVDRGLERYSLTDVCEAIDKQLMQLSVAVIDNEIVAVFVTEVINYPQAKALRAVFTGGERVDEWLADFDAYLDEGARAVGADLVEMHGRLGWLKKLRPICQPEEVTTILSRPVRGADAERKRA
jgi:hypothetical protein